MAASGASAADALSAATDAFAAAGVDTPRLDAEVLLSELAGIDRATLVTDRELALEPAAARAFSEAVRRRIRREPVAYILGNRGFRHIDLTVDRRVLIPRPETEMLVELALEVDPGTVLEIGTGSGAIALAVADELPGSRVTATEVSDGAIEVAVANAARLGLGDRVGFELGSLPDGPGEFDLILANLPYVPDSDGLPPEVGQWEPEGALFGGPDGTDVIAEVLTGFGRAGIEAPVIGLEIGQGQGEKVAEMVRQAGWPEAEIRLDLAGIDRVVIGRR
ncbi:MAG: peptide chain release factor N(5)-glutamine methyltransferase [Solirubrobacterales bacterium]|nr:peptide chain release factor N(5)-glutamine methyltransferase [Solirubrobacterales bacterium]MCB0863893.1 peptide chain release factor N(5)-glutamine methyltransferase [Solirubrobacterales bacterium]MCB0871199.1 peptide chain release factor N(5)-glutamine methyltransferase [Solirubrobacterales bacterium]MCB8914932.1 peptide chain release factor N(5)-glutamine methyltransferase [Thermoleophilales bacterium]